MTARARASGSEPWLGVAIVALVAVRLFVAVLLIAAPLEDDPWVSRAETIATSPATPYRHFSVALMPAETLAVELLGGDGTAATARRVAAVAFVADLAIATALVRGWGRRTAALSLAIGLPLLGVAYTRLDLVSVALVAWAAALFRERRDGASGTLLALAVWWKLWPIVLAPAAWAARRRATLVPAAVVVAVGGLAWFLWGGRDGPIQVLTTREAVGWSITGTVGSVVRLVTGDPALPEAGALRVDAIPLWARGLLFVALVLVQLAIWRDARRDGRRDPSGATAVASIAALLALAPSPPALAAAWAVPFAAVALDGDREERRVGVLAASAVILSGVLTLRDPATEGAAVALVALVRNLLWFAAVAWWLTRPLGASSRAPSAVAAR